MPRNNRLKATPMSTDAKVLLTVILTSVFWLLVLPFYSISVHEDAYRMGYAEGKAEMPSRYDHQAKEGDKP